MIGSFKTFEAFGDAVQGFDKKVELLLLIQNIGIGQGSFDLELELDPVRFPYLTTLLEGDKLVKIPNKFPKMSMLEKGNVEKLFNSLDSKYKISQLPDIHDVRKYLQGIKILGFEAEETIVLLKPGTFTEYGNRVKLDRTHYRFRVVTSDEDSEGRRKYLALQENISDILTKLEGRYKTEFIIGGETSWAEYKIMVANK